MDVHGVIVNVFLFIILPAGAIAAAIASFGGRLSIAGRIIGGLLIAAALIYMPVGTLQTIAGSIGSGLSKFLGA